MNKKKLIIPIILTTFLTATTTTTLSAVQTIELNNETSEIEIKELPLNSARNINLALNKPVVAGLIRLDASKIIEFEEKEHPATNAVDGNISTRWGTPSGKSEAGEKTLVVDLGASKAVKSFKIDFEKPNVKKFSIEGSNDNSNFEQIIDNDKENELTKIINLEELSNAYRYFRLRISEWGPSVPPGYFNVGVNEFAIFEKDYVVDGLDLDNPNFALKKPTEASSTIEGKHPTSNAVDDKNVYFNSVWASKPESRNGIREAGVPLNYFIVDLEELKTVSAFNVEFEKTNVLEFVIEVSSNKEKWTTVHTSKAANVKEHLINLNSSYSNVRFVRIRATRLVINSYMNVGINNIGVYEKHLPAVELRNITPVGEPRIVNDKLVLPSVPKGYEIDFLGADYEQVIGDDLTIHRPLSSRNVQVSYQIMNSVTRNRRSKVNEVITKTVFVPGSKAESRIGNKKPNILNEISEWYSNKSENLTIKNDAKINFIGEKTKEVDTLLKILQDEYLAITKRELAINFDAFPTGLNGEIIIDLSKKNMPGYDEETYGIIIDNNVTIKATNRTGALWATRTLLQILQLSDTKNMMPKGEIKDYPKYKKRGVSLDVARKPVSLETLKAYVKELSWRKLNQFQIHLSDNYIWLEHYRNDQKAFDNAVAGWRLESSIENSAGKKLASEDFHYTKEEFAEFIQYSKEYGVEIVPELDVPAHSLAFTRLFPEFALEGNHGRRSTKDHIDIRKPEAVEKLIELFDDYINPGGIFGDGKTTVHIGADEFTPPSGKNEVEFITAYYNFLQKMLKHFTEKNVKVRIWGTISALEYEKASNAYLDENLIKNTEMNIWNFNQSHPNLVYNTRYKIINTLNHPLYIVPGISAAGTRSNGYADKLEIDRIYNNWEVNNLSGTVLPAGSKQLEGGMFAIWSDYLLDKATTGLNEIDTFARFQDAVNVVGLKVWGNVNNGNDLSFNNFTQLVNKIGEVPTSNPYLKQDVLEHRNQFFNYDFSGKNETEKLFDKRGDYGFISELNNAAAQSENDSSYLKLNGGNSNAKLPVNILGLNNSLKFRIRRLQTDTNQEDEIIFSGKWAYGDFSIKAKQKHTSSFGFSREGLDYSFAYTLPFNQWVDIEIRNPFDFDVALRGQTRLLVDGVDKGIATGKIFRDGNFITKLETNNTLVFDNSTMFLPLDLIGSKTSSFKGDITNISVQPLELKNTMNKQQTDEFNRLSELNLSLFTIIDKPVNQVQPSQIIISGLGETETSRIIPETLKYDETNRIINVQVERTSKKIPSVKFINNMILSASSINVANRVSDVAKALKNFREVNDFSVYTISSELLYKSRLNAIKRFLGATAVNDEDFKTFEKLLSQIPNILIRVSTEASNLFNNRTINELEYTPESVIKRRELLNSPEFKALEQKFKSSPNIFNRNDLRATSDLVNRANTQLVQNKTILEGLIRQEIQKIRNKRIYTSQSEQNYINKVNEFLGEILKMKAVTRLQLADYQNRLIAFKPLLKTLKTLISERLENLKNSLSGDYTAESLVLFNNEFESLKQIIDNSETITINDFDSLNQRILNARTLLETIKNSLTNEIEIKNHEIKNSDFYHEISVKTYLAETQKINNKLSHTSNFNEQQRQQFLEQLEKLNSILVTYQSLVIKKLDELQKSLGDSYTEQSKKIASEIISKLRDQIVANPRINRLEYNDLIEQIEQTKTALVQVKNIDPPNVPPKENNPISPIIPPTTAIPPTNSNPITPDTSINPVDPSPSTSPTIPDIPFNDPTELSGEKIVIAVSGIIGGMAVSIIGFITFLHFKNKNLKSKFKKKKRK